MKTNELKRKLSEDLIECYQENDDVIYGQFWTVSKKNQSLLVHGVIPLGVLKVLGEYHNTPISEREDEKKYRIIINNNLTEMIEYLTLRLSNRTCYFSIFDYNEQNYQRIFTQQEIDNLLAEIKAAIDCGFLRKVEVK